MRLPRSLCLLLCIGGLPLANTVSSEIAVGSSYEQVIAELGQPSGEMKMGQKRILSYRGGVVKIENGRVVYIDPQFKQNVAREEEHAAFVNQQKAKGLVFHKGLWVTPEEKQGEILSQRRLRDNRVAATMPPIKDIRDDGRIIDLYRVAIPGQITIIDFYADWCGPCKALSPHLEQIAARHPDIFLRKIDIVTWGTPVCKQYNIRSIPNVRIFNGDGEMVGEPTSGLSEIRRNLIKAKSTTN